MNLFLDDFVDFFKAFIFVFVVSIICSFIACVPIIVWGGVWYTYAIAISAGFGWLGAFLINS